MLPKRYKDPSTERQAPEKVPNKLQIPIRPRQFLRCKPWVWDLGFGVWDFHLAYFLHENGFIDDTYSGPRFPLLALPAQHQSVASALPGSSRGEGDAEPGIWPGRRQGHAVGSLLAREK